MRKFCLIIAIAILLSCSGATMPTDPLGVYEPTPVVRMLILNGDTIYHPNQ